MTADVFVVAAVGVSAVIRAVQANRRASRTIREARTVTVPAVTRRTTR